MPRVVEDRGQRRKRLGSFVEGGRPVRGRVGGDVTRRLPAAERRGSRRGVHARVADVRVVVRAARRSGKHDRVVVVAMAEAAGDVEVPASGESGGSHARRSIGTRREGGRGEHRRAGSGSEGDEKTETREAVRGAMECQRTGFPSVLGEASPSHRLEKGTTARPGAKFGSRDLPYQCLVPSSSRGPP